MRQVNPIVRLLNLGYPSPTPMQASWQLMPSSQLMCIDLRLVKGSMYKRPLMQAAMQQTYC